MDTLHFPTGRRFDLACLGRLAVDLYAQQIGCRLEDATSFAKYLGGSSANVAFGTARLGLKSTMISRVGNEQMGRFLIETLQREGCDTSQVQIDPERLTALVLLGLKDRDTFPLLFYRENCADMAIDAALIDERHVAQCRALAITGTHLSTPGTRRAATTALQYARKHGVVRVLDIDYRPVLWGLTPRGEGENRYLPDAGVTLQLQQVLGQFDLVVGTEEEFLIAGGVPGDLIASLQAVRAVCAAVLVVKRGALGCCVIEGEVPVRIDDAPTYAGERVEVLNVLGAGDAFLAGLMCGLLDGHGWEAAARIANACGALVVSRHGCAPAMPTREELAHWFSTHRSTKVATDAQLAHLHRVTVPRKPWSDLCVMAFDHRSQFFELAREAGAEESRIAPLKRLLVQAVESVAATHDLHGRVGLLVDAHYGEEALHEATGRGWWVGRPVELPGSRPLRFDGTDSIASQLLHWPAEQVVKCLVHYHPDDPPLLRLEQESQLRTLWEATRESGHELLIEVIPPRGLGLAPDEAVLRSITRLYNLGFKPEWWKLAPMTSAGWDALHALVQQRDPHCRGAVILGLNQPLGELVQGFAQARSPIVRGFMVGRTLWAGPSLRWLRGACGDDELVASVAGNFGELVSAWSARHAVLPEAA